VKIIAVAGRMGTGKDTISDILAESGWQRVALADRIKQCVHKLFAFDRATLFGPSDNRNRVWHENEIDWNRAFFNAGLWYEEFYVMMAAGSRLSSYKGDLRMRDTTEKLYEFVSASRVAAMHDKFSARWALQQLGTEYGRSMRDDVWIVNAEHTIDAIQRGYRYDPLTGIDYSREGFGGSPPGVIITDCRFRNEAEHFRAVGAKVYWIDASRRIGTQLYAHASEPDMAVFVNAKAYRIDASRQIGTQLYAHASEPQMAVFEGELDGVIDNNGTLADLATEVRRIISDG